MNINVGQWMSHRTNLLENKEAFIGKRGRYTFLEMNRLVNSFANFLIKKGIKAGDRLALVCKNHEDFVITFFGCAKIGVITIPVNWRLTDSETSYILQNCGAKAVVFDDVFHEKMNEIQPEIQANLYICSGESEQAYSFSDIFSTSNTEEPEIQTADEDTVLIMYTSGTTGKPKGAMFSHYNLLAASLGLTHTIDWWEHDRFLLVAPFFHIGGFAPLLANVHTGCTTILLEDFDPVVVWKTIEKEKVTTMMTVPTMLAYMEKTVEKLKPDYSSLRNITCGASPVPPQLIELFNQIGISVQQVYGITEYAGAVTFWKKSMDPKKYESMGKAVMHGEIKIVDIDSQEELPSGEVGEIYCHGPQVFQGYWQNEIETNKVFVDGWYRSGDLGAIDEDGFLYVVDRLKDMIISGGENIYSPEVEDMLARHPDIVEAAVVGMPNEKWGEVPYAYIVKAEQSTLTETDVMTHCKDHLASYKIPKAVVFVEELPRNAVGKILKQALKQNKQITS